MSFSATVFPKTWEAALYGQPPATGDIAGVYRSAGTAVAPSSVFGAARARAGKAPRLPVTYPSDLFGFFVTYDEMRAAVGGDYKGVTVDLRPVGERELAVDFLRGGAVVLTRRYKITREANHGAVVLPSTKRVEQRGEVFHTTKEITRTVSLRRGNDGCLYVKEAQHALLNDERFDTWARFELATPEHND